MAKKEKSQKKHKRTSPLIKLILLVLLAALGYQLVALQAKVKQAREQEQQLAEQVQQQALENASISAEIQQAQDPDQLEDLARGQLGMVYSNEKVFIDSSNPNR